MWLLCVWLLCVWLVLDPPVSLAPYLPAPPAPDHPTPDRPKYRSFFPLPTPLFFFSSLSWEWWCFRSSFFLSLTVCLLVEFWCEDRDPPMCPCGLSGCRVKPRRLRGRRGFTRQPKNSKREGSGASNTTKIPREDTQRETKRMKMGAGEGKKKREILGSPPFGAPPWHHPPFLGPILFGPFFFWVWAPPFGDHHDTKLDLAKNGLAKIGQIRMAKTGLAKVGPFPSNTACVLRKL